MNWLGIDLRGFLGAVFGCVAGALLFFYARHRGVDLPPIVGLSAGLGAMLASRVSSVTRGLVVGSLAIWACAIAEVLASPVHGLASDLFHFSDRVGVVRFLGYAGCAVLAILLGARARAGTRGAPPIDEDGQNITPSAT